MVYGRGRPGVEMGNTLCGLFVMTVAVLIGVRWGLPGLCLAWLTGFPIVFGFQLRRSAAVAEVPPLAVLRATVPALVASLLMMGTVLAFKAWYDNTSANRANPDPNQWVGWGDRTVDEMGHAWVNVTYMNDDDFAAAVAERGAREAEITQNQGQ